MPSWASNKQAGIKSRRSHRCGVNMWGLWSPAYCLVHASAELNSVLFFSIRYSRSLRQEREGRPG